MKAEIRYATRADFDELFEVPLPHRVRALAVQAGDELLGVGGLVFQPDGTTAAFVVMKPDAAKRYPVALHRAGIRMMGEARRLGIKRVVALAEEFNPAAEPWLERLGFKPVQVDGETAWVWEDSA